MLNLTKQLYALVKKLLFILPRGEQARLLGYRNFAHMSMETKMAGSVDNVLSMITSLLAQGMLNGVAYPNLFELVTLVFA